MSRPLAKNGAVPFNSGLAEMRTYASLKQVHKLGLHELEIVRNAKADDALPSKAPLKLGCKLLLMLFLHDEDHVGPFNELGRQRILRVVVRAR